MLYVEILTVLVLIAINGFLAMSELAVVSSRPARLRAMVAQGVHGSRRALALASDPGRFLSTVQIGITLVGILAGAVSGATIGARLAAWLTEHGLSRAIAEPVAVGLVVAVITYLSLIAGELVPKHLALRRPEVIACRIAPALTIIAQIASPAVWLLDISSRAVLRVLGQRSQLQSLVTEEEIRTLVAEAESAGTVEPEERAMIARVMRLGDRSVRAVMTPRPEVDLIDISQDPAAVRQAMLASIHSRFPAYDGDPEEIVGILHAKDVLGAYASGQAVDLRAMVRAAPVIPETADALEVVEVLRASPVHIGLVHDEYGHFQGVATSADILEAIVGVFRTEEAAEPPIVRRPDGSHLVSGSMQVEEFAEAFGITLPEQRDYHTVAGLALSIFNRIPEVGESADAYGYRFEVIDMDGMRIDKVLVAKLPPRRRAA